MSRQQSQPMKRTRQSIGGTTRDTANPWPLRSSLELGAADTCQVQVRPVAVMNDPDILRRIRDGLRDLSDC